MQHHSNPLPDTLERVPGYPSSLKIYRVPCSEFYWARCYMSGKRVTQSTETRNKQLAFKAAGEFYDELLLKRAKKEPLTTGGQFARLFEEMLELDRQKVASGDRAQSLVDDAEYMHKKDLLPFFKNDQIKSINHKRLLEFVASLRERNLSGRTIKNYLIILNKMLKHAYNTNVIDKIPLMPAIAVKTNTRDWLDENQYEYLKKVIDDEVKKNVKVNHQPITNELKLLVSFMFNTFLRPQDLRIIQHKDIKVVCNRTGKDFLRIMARGKVKSAPIVSLEHAVRIYKDLVKLNGDNPDDFLLFPKMSREYAQQTIQRQFRHVLEKAGLKTGTDGKPRTLYSLRHSVVMYCLRNKSINPFTLASNCRTSVEMIKLHYGSHYEAEMNVNQFHELREGGIAVDREPVDTLEQFFEDDEVTER
jgi:integrase